MKTKDRVVFLDNEEKTGTIKTIKGNICVVHTDAGNIMAPLSMLRVVEEYVSPTVPESPSCDTEPQAAQADSTQPNPETVTVTTTVTATVTDARDECTPTCHAEGEGAPTYTEDNKYMRDRAGDLYVSVSGIYIPAKIVSDVDEDGKFVAELSITPAQCAALEALPPAHEVTLDVRI